MDDDSPARLPKVTTYIWRYDMDQQPKKTAMSEAPVQVDSSPDKPKIVSRILKKYEPERRQRKKTKGEYAEVPATARKAIQQLTRLRPQKDKEGAKVRKQTKRRLKAEIVRRQKKRSAAARKRKLQARVKREVSVAEPYNGEDTDTLFDNLMREVVLSVRGKRTYTNAPVEYIIKVGTSPSAGGSRSAIASILSHNGDQLCGKVTIPHAR